MKTYNFCLTDLKTNAIPSTTMSFLLFLLLLLLLLYWEKQSNISTQFSLPTVNPHCAKFVTNTDLIRKFISNILLSLIFVNILFSLSLLLIKIQYVAYTKCVTYHLLSLFYSWIQENVYVKSSMQQALTTWRLQVKISAHEEYWKMNSYSLIIPISLLVILKLIITTNYHILKLVNTFFS